MIYLPESNVVFLHVPKTGGTWVRTFLKFCVPDYEPMGDAVGHGGLTEARELVLDRYGRDVARQTKYLAFVRHPVAWYRSYYSMRVLQDWSHEPGDELYDCKAITFSDFVINVFRKFPNGFLAKFFEQYTGEPNSGVFVGKQETLTDDLATFFGEIEECFDSDLARNIPAMNIGSMFPAVFDENRCSEAILNLIAEKDGEVFERYGYRVEDPPHMKSIYRTVDPDYYKPIKIEAR